ncbi:MAG: hypothetical protein H6818_08810 [Phycisphaerales bacterium]|nr:hypothetical protein [Phycisphaerales bacterium]MCB9862671.1 hypothetical protein [Phycisphaerales bacterium]
MRRYSHFRSAGVFTSTVFCRASICAAVASVLLAVPIASAQITGTLCSAPENAIPDFGTTDDVIIVPINGTILDLNVELLISHPFQGDLIVTLQHLETGTLASLLHRCGDSAGGGTGFAADNFGNPLTGERFILDDEAAEYYDIAMPDGWGDPGVADPGIDNVTGSWIPFDNRGSGQSHTLRYFDGEDISGHWKIYVSDHLPGAVGTLHEWCLRWTVLDPADLIGSDCGGYNLSFESADFSGWMTQDLAVPALSMRIESADFPTGVFEANPTDGIFAMYHGFDGAGPGVIRIAQEMDLPPGTRDLRFDYRAAWNMFLATMDRTFSVQIEPAGGGTPLETVLIMTAAAGEVQTDTGDLVGIVDVSAYAGTTVRIAFEWNIPEAFGGPGLFQFDSVRCYGDDCNANGVDDREDLGNGTSQDCNANAIPDDCEADADGDGVPDDCDGCPDDVDKLLPGVCGCGATDDDSDDDGVPDCFDDCPDDPNKIASGFCGCGTADRLDDADDDGVIDCLDNCPAVANPDQADSDGNGVGDACEPPPGGAAAPCGLIGLGAGAAWMPLMLLGWRWMKHGRGKRY